MSQPLTVADCQDLIEKIMVKSGWDKRSPEDQGLGLAEESGEACRALLAITRHGVTPERKQELALELADTLMYLCWIGRMYGIDLGEAFMQKAAKVNGGILNRPEAA